VLKMLALHDAGLRFVSIAEHIVCLTAHIVADMEKALMLASKSLAPWTWLPILELFAQVIRHSSNLLSSPRHEECCLDIYNHSHAL